MTTKRIPPSKAVRSLERAGDPVLSGRKVGSKQARKAAPPKLTKSPSPAVTPRRPAPAKARSAARPAVPPSTPRTDPALAGGARAAPRSVTQEPVYSRTAPYPIRITFDMKAKLQSKADRTGVPMQELIRRAISHMLRTFKLEQVPDRAEA